MNLEEKKKFIINFTYFAVWIIIIYLLLKVAAIYLLPFLIGIIIAYVVQKPAVFISKKTKLKKQNCAAVLSVVIFILVIVIMALLIWFLYTRFGIFISNFSNHTGNIRNYIERTYEYFENFLKNIDGDFQDTFKKFTSDTLNNFITKIGAFLSSSATTLIKNLPSLLIGCAVTVVATCYISKDYGRLLKFVKGFITDKFYNRIIEIKNIFTECFFKFAVGYFWLFVITFSELAIGFLILRIKHFIILALLVALLDLLPIIGTGTVLLPWAAVMFFQNDFKLGIGLVVLYLAITVIRNFAEPKIIGKQIGINPLFTLIFIFLGLRLGGIMGMLVLPVVLTVFFTYYRRQFIDNN